MKPDEFEKQLGQRPIKAVPPEWKDEILAAARTAASAAPREPGSRLSLVSAINAYLSTVLRLRPRTLAGLAAVWVLIMAFHFATHDESPAVAHKTAVSPELIAQAREQRLFYAEMVGLRETLDAEPPAIHSPRPRSERRAGVLTA